MKIRGRKSPKVVISDRREHVGSRALCGRKMGHVIRSCGASKTRNSCRIAENPFCYLGSVWAEQAARQLQADLRWLFEIHPDTPPEGAPKPFSPEEWPQVRERLEGLAQGNGLPIDPAQNNLDSR